MSQELFIAPVLAQIPTAGQDVIAVYDQEFNQVFRLARPLKATVKETSKTMKSPIELGAETSDHSIILPNEIELSLLLTSPNYKNTYDQIKQFFLNRSLLIVQTRTDQYTNMLIESMPHEEDAEKYDAIIMAMTLIEVLIVKGIITDTIVPANPNNNSTVRRGTVNPQPATPAQEAENRSILHETLF